MLTAPAHLTYQSTTKRTNGCSAHAMHKHTAHLKGVRAQDAAVVGASEEASINQDGSALQVSDT